MGHLASYLAAPLGKALAQLADAVLCSILPPYDYVNVVGHNDLGTDLEFWMALLVLTNSRRRVGEMY